MLQTGNGLKTDGETVKQGCIESPGMGSSFLLRGPDGVECANNLAGSVSGCEDGSQSLSHGQVNLVACFKHMFCNTAEAVTSLS